MQTVTDTQEQSIPVPCAWESQGVTWITGAYRWCHLLREQGERYNWYIKYGGDPHYRWRCIGKKYHPTGNHYLFIPPMENCFPSQSPNTHRECITWRLPQVRKSLKPNFKLLIIAFLNCKIIAHEDYKHHTHIRHCFERGCLIIDLFG